MYPFEKYLKTHRLEALQVSVIGNVRYMAVYNAIKGFPITTENARSIRQAVFSMTGLPFTGEFVLHEPESEVDAPTIQIKKLPRHV